MNQTITQSAWVLPFQSADSREAEISLALVGGKGANLARLVQAGFPVPDGFLISTQAYRDFVRVNALEERIQELLPNEADANLLESTSDQIRALFREGQLPPGLAEDVAGAYARIGSPPVAVRSSATAEDLPEMSFAGQQDTYLNVVGISELLESVVKCWSSLWTARAIGYRMRNHVPQMDMALAVVVQQMVESHASGVLFTANPLTGLRAETVIDATFGLGEALVSGQVEPDHYVVDTKQLKIIEKQLGAKALSIHGKAGGGTAQREETRNDRQALTDEQILELAKLGQAVSEQYHFPQDIEWALADDRLYLLQSRAITSLYPTPDGVPPDPLKVFFSFGAVQGMLDPITPVGRDTLKLIFAAGSRLFRIYVTPETQRVLYSGGERLWINTTTPFRNTVGRKVMHTALDLVEPTVRQAMMILWDEPRLMPERQGFRPHALLQIAGFFLPLAGNIFLNLISPRKRREFVVNQGEQILKILSQHIAAISGTPRERLAQTADLLPQLVKERLLPMFLRFVSVVASGMASFNFVRMLTKGHEPVQPENLPNNGRPNQNETVWSDLLLELTRGLPHNPTTEMDLDLWNVARVIQKDPELMEEFNRYDAPELAQRYQSGKLPRAGQEIVGKFLERYGARGFGEIDLARPRWNDDPTHVFEVLSSYIQIDQPELSPDVVFARGEGAAQKALDQLCAVVQDQHGGWFKTRLVRFFAGRMRELMGARESPKFFAVRLFALLRAPLLQAGADLARSGDLDHADDVFYLSYNEMKAFAAQEPVDWKELIAKRREAYQRELMRRQVPRLLLSDGRAFYEGIIAPADDAQRGDGAAGNFLHGSPVSPGRAEGNVRVVLNPREANLKPGEILVCPGTDPSWTPLFLSAGGLVMEVGGMMTHGAVVAREYGIPAIVGVDQATRRLHTGQKIRIDGSTGVIQHLDGIEQETVY